jgi:hypothetical protein
MTWKTHKAFAVALMMPLLTSGCVNTMTQAGATEVALCDEWGDSLPTRSRADTTQTQDEIQVAIATHAAVCLG